MPYAVLNLHTRPVQIDHEGTYAVADNSPRYHVQPMSMGEGPAIFPEFDEAEEWRGKRVAEMKESTK